MATLRKRSSSFSTSIKTTRISYSRRFLYFHFLTTLFHSTMTVASASKSPHAEMKRRSARLMDRPQISTAFQAFAATYSPQRKNSTRPSKRWNVVTPTKESSAKRSKVSLSATSRSSSRTQSFGAMTASQFVQDYPHLVDDNFRSSVEVHTLILGTHPSVQSLERQEYFGHPMNAFWWIAGDCLGFRRGPGVTKAGKPYKFSESLWHTDPEDILEYPNQLKRLTESGFALWDIVQSCQRPGSLDSDITKDVPNDIQGFCKAHPSLKRIVFANGTSGSKFFIKHFADWLNTGEIVPYDHPQTLDVFSKWASPDDDHVSLAPITLISALAVSPAAARFTYAEKRDFWHEHVYQPGLKDLERSQQPT